MRVTDLDTPSLLVDLPRLEANLKRMAGYARAAGLQLRPHTKTHKTPQIAKLQLAHGAAGITVAKLGEAEVMAEAGFTDVFIANEIVGPQKVARLLAVSRRVTTSVGVDSLAVAVPLSEAFAAEGRRLPVLLEVDLGLHRCGVRPDQATALAEQIAALGGLELAGVFGYAGHVYATRSESEVAEVAAQEARDLGSLAAGLRALTASDLRASGGSAVA
jgi:D-serine deaminase-like pyridoxal phosphate-dependent protein